MTVISPKIRTLSFVVCSAVAALTGSARADGGREPVLVELFTSEGCSSCPPADRWLDRLDATQFIPNARAIVLSEHVDYWDHDGWKDAFSSHAFSERQRAYTDLLHLGDPYTPQLVVDGFLEVQGNDPAAILKIFQKASLAPKAPIELSFVNSDASQPREVQARIEIDGRSAASGGDVYVALALNRVETQVSGGENSGKRLTHVAVVQEMTKVGKLAKGQSLSLDYRRTLKPGVEPANVRIVVFIQQGGPGRIIGAALKEMAAP